MSSEFHAVSHFCVSQCTDAQRSPASTTAHSSVTGDNASPSGQFQQSRHGQLSAVSDEIIAVDSADSDVVDSEGGICGKPYCATKIIVGSTSWPQQQRPLAFCAAVDSCNINSGLAYHRLPAACWLIYRCSGARFTKILRKFLRLSYVLHNFVVSFS